MKNWLWGGLIGLLIWLIGIILYKLFWLTEFGIISIPFLFITFILAKIIGVFAPEPSTVYVGGKVTVSVINSLAIATIISPFVYFLLGAIIGWIVGIINRKLINF